LPYFCMSSKFFSIVISLNGNRRIRQTGPRSRPSPYLYRSAQ
jgi:hypothetical protein